MNVLFSFTVLFLLAHQLSSMTIKCDERSCTEQSELLLSKVSESITPVNIISYPPLKPMSMEDIAKCHFTENGLILCGNCPETSPNECRVFTYQSCAGTYNILYY